MKSLMYIFLACYLLGCKNYASNTESNSRKSEYSMSCETCDDSTQNTIGYYDLDMKYCQAYQTFDELTMKGKGTAEKQPCVYVWDKGDSIFVKSSDERDSLRLYVRKGKDMWYSHMDYELWKKNGYRVVKSEWDKMARSYDRYFYNDTILEVKTDYSDDFIYKTIFVKTSDVVFEFRMSDKDFKSYADDLRSKVGLLCSGKMTYKGTSPKVIKYSFSYDDNKYYLRSKETKTTYEYPKTALGVWAMQPGLDETCLYGGQDIRNFTQSTPNGVQNVAANDTTIYELVDKVPDFPGGWGAMKDFYAKNEASTSRTQDYNHRVVLKFVVECDGTITNGRVIDSPSPEYTNKAMKLLSLMPKWTPAELGGRAVRHESGLPFCFK